MRIAPHQRRAALGAALILTLVASVVSSDSEDGREIVQPVGKSPPAFEVSGREQAASSTLARLDIARVSRRSDESSVSDPFAPKSWYTPPPPVTSAPAKPAAPVAPPLSFVYLGRMTDASGKVVVYLNRAERVFAVQAGDILDDQYRLETVSEVQLGFVYLPLNARQTLTIPAQ